MLGEILPVSLEDKGAVIQYTRNNLIPSLVGEDLDAERILLILHRIGTWRAKPLRTEAEGLADSYIALYAGINPVPKNRLELESELAKLQVIDPERFSPYAVNYLKGNYRILGCFSPNQQMAQIAPETSEYFTGAIPVSTLDYHQPEGYIYFPPIFNIHKLMAFICNTFDGRFTISRKPEDVAKTIVDFYFWGLMMVHPFLGGNHRAYDRFVEYGFSKKGLRKNVPLDNTLNISPSHPFNLALYKERGRLLKNNGFTGQNFNLSHWKELDKYLRYQHELNDFLFDCQASDCANTEEAAKALLSWQ